MVDWNFIYKKYTEGIRRRTARLRGQYMYGYLWDWNTRLEAGGSEDFNEPYILKEGECFIDGGAAYGFWAIRAAKFYKTVVAIEPDLNTFNELKRNIALNRVKNIVPMDAALSDKIGTQMFYENARSLLREHTGLQFSGKSRTVILMTIDEICKRMNYHPTVIKLDVEGAEASALRGGIETIRKFKPTLIVEVHPPIIPGDIEDLFPDYAWKTRWRYLRTDVYPFEKQAHLLGIPNDS